MSEPIKVVVWTSAGQPLEHAIWADGVWLETDKQHCLNHFQEGDKLHTMALVPWTEWEEQRQRATELEGDNLSLKLNNVGLEEKLTHKEQQIEELGQEVERLKKLLESYHNAKMSEVEDPAVAYAKATIENLKRMKL